MANNIFKKNNILIQGLLSDSYEFLQRVYNQSRNVFTVASAWGQILFVLENISQMILYFIEDSITELNIQEASRTYSIKSLARLAGHDPSRGMAAQGEVLIAWNLKESDAGGGAVFIQENSRIQCLQNGTPYSLILNAPSMKVPLNRTASFNFKIVQGAFTKAVVTGTGKALQSFNIPSKSGALIDHFYVNVYVNGNKWNRYESLYDIPLEREGFLIRSGISEGVDVYFGNSMHGKIPQAGSRITVEYLQTSGYSGNIQSSGDKTLSYRFLDEGTDLFGNTVNLNNYIKIEGVLDPSFGADPEPIEITRLVAPKTSRSFVFANSENYEIFLHKFNIFSQIQAFSTFDDDYLDDDNVIYVFLVPDVTIGMTSNQDYFDITENSFLLSISQRLSILNLIEDSGQMIATTVVKIIEPEIKRFIGNVSMSIFEGFDPEVLRDKVRTAISDYMLNNKRRDSIPKSDIIALIEGIDGIDSVSFNFIGEDNEKYHTSINNLANISAAQSGKQIGLDYFGDIIIGRGELVLMRGGWNDRNGISYETGIIDGKPSALNISIISINSRNFISKLNDDSRKKLISQNR